MFLVRLSGSGDFLGLASGLVWSGWRARACVNHCGVVMVPAAVCLGLALGWGIFSLLVRL